MSGIKHDQGKPDYTFISMELLDELAAVRAFGAKKYSRNNWKKGFKVSRSLAAALRHIFAFLSGQTSDPESGLSHLGHAACCLEHAIYDMKHHPQNDDREGKETAPLPSSPELETPKVKGTSGSYQWVPADSLGDPRDCTLKEIVELDHRPKDHKSLIKIDTRQLSELWDHDPDHERKAKYVAK